MAGMSVYATIDELELETSKHPAVVKSVASPKPLRPLVAVRTAAPLSEADLTPVPPPLPPPNQSSALHSPTLLVKDKFKPISHSDENVCQTHAAVEVSGVLHLSSSSPALNLLGKDSAQGVMDLTDGSNFPVYSVVTKKKTDASDVPPPLPPPLALDTVSEVTGNGEVTGLDSEGVLFIPNYGAELKAPRAGGPHPKVHVYETVPDDIAQGPPKKLKRRSTRGSFRKACRKKKYHTHKTEKGVSRLSISPLPGLISLSELEPLPPSGVTMRLCDFVKKFCHYLPLCVRVDEGYCGTEERFVISSGDVYNLHFVKNEKVVSILDCGGNNFSTPLNSAIEFGLLYNPSNDFNKAALSGYQFKTVSEIAAAKITPRIICATRMHNTSEIKTSVQVGEVLIVKKVSRTTVLRKPMLKAVSLKSNEDKILQEDCEGHFSTSPELVKLYLPEILEHFGTCFPLDAMLYMKHDAKEELPLHLTSDIVTLTQTTVETSIIASTCWADDRQEELSEEDRALVAIPVDLDIEVTFLGKESDNNELYESTRNFFEMFSSLKITDMKNSGGMQSGAGSSSAQTKLYNVVREDCPSEWTEIKMPYRLSGVFDGEVSPLMRKLSGDNHVYYDLDGNVTSSNSSPSQSSPANENGETTSTSSDSVRTHPCALPPELSYPAQSPFGPIPNTTSAIARKASSHASVCRDLNSKFCSTIDETPADGNIDDNYDYIVTTNRRSSLNLPLWKPGDGQDRVPEIPLTPPVSHHHQSRIRADSLLVSSNRLLPDRNVGTWADKNGDDDVQGGRGEGERKKRMTFYELSKNYAKLEVQVQELTRELQSTRVRQAHQGDVSEEKVLVRTQTLPDWVRPKSKSRVKASSLADQERNMKELRMLDHDEILMLLKAMNLSQYKDNFKKEQVDGEILADCDETMLEQDLLLVSAIHRNRLMKLITGKHSASSLMAGEDNFYSNLDHRT